MKQEKRTMRRTILRAVFISGAITWAAAPVSGQTVCDTLYWNLQDLAVEHIRANEVWIEHFINCPPAAQAFGAFILSELGQEGTKDRALIATYVPRAGWLYRFSEQAPNIRFVRPSPLIDVDGDGQMDIVFTTADNRAPNERSYHIALTDEGKKRSTKTLAFTPGLVIDSLLPAPAGKARPLQMVDRRGREIGGLNAGNAPISYRYLELDPTLDPPDYVNQTAKHAGLYPVMQQRAEYVKALPGSDLLEYDSAETYEAFLVNIIGYCLDQSNLGREVDGFLEVRAILDRVRYKGSTQVLEAPRTVCDRLQQALPEAKKLPRKRN